MKKNVQVGRRDQDETWEPLDNIKHKEAYVLKLVKAYDEKMKTLASGVGQYCFRLFSLFFFAKACDEWRQTHGIRMCLSVDTDIYR